MARSRMGHLGSRGRSGPRQAVRGREAERQQGQRCRGGAERRPLLDQGLGQRGRPRDLGRRPEPERGGRRRVFGHDRERAVGQRTLTLRQARPAPTLARTAVSCPDASSRKVRRKPSRSGAPAISKRSRSNAVQRTGSLSNRPVAALPLRAYESHTGVGSTELPPGDRRSASCRLSRPAARDAATTTGGWRSGTARGARR